MSGFSVTLQCSNDATHVITLPSTAKRPTTCPACVLGKPCAGVLAQVGKRAA